MNICIHCNHKTESNFFCDSCNKILPITDKNYFELFGIAPSINTDFNSLQKEYFKLQVYFHPDKYINKPKQEKEISDSNSAYINKAYKILTNKFDCSIYLLSLYKMGDISEAQIPTPFLTQVYMWHTALEEASSETERAEVINEVSEMREQLWEEFESRISTHTSTAIETLAKIKYLNTFEYSNLS